MDEQLVVEHLGLEGFYDHAHLEKGEVPMVCQKPANGDLRPVAYLDEFGEGWIQ